MPAKSSAKSSKARRRRSVVTLGAANLVACLRLGETLSMYCPLCKSGFRDGFTRCSDCHIPLVTSEGEAAQTAVDCLWKGDNRSRCDQILDALIAANIPCQSKESLKKHPWPWISILLWRFIRPRPTFELQIWVLGSDFSRAQAAVPAELRDDWEDEDQDVKPALT